MEHTKGEWKVMHEINVESEQGYVCSCGGQRGNMAPGEGMDMNRANAKLISAAPDLLERLKKTTETLRYLIDGRILNIKEEAIILRNLEVIKKATE